MFDFCSNDEYKHRNKDDCLNVKGCCFAEVETKNRRSCEYDDDKDSDCDTDISNTSSTCFRRYKLEKGDTCTDYIETTALFDNVVTQCECNE